MSSSSAGGVASLSNESTLSASPSSSSPSSSEFEGLEDLLVQKDSAGGTTTNQFKRDSPDSRRAAAPRLHVSSQEQRLLGRDRVVAGCLLPSAEFFQLGDSECTETRQDLFPGSFSTNVLIFVLNLENLALLIAATSFFNVR